MFHVVFVVVDVVVVVVFKYCVFVWSVDFTTGVSAAASGAVHPQLHLPGDLQH